MWLIVGQLTIKAGWQDAHLVLWDFSRSNKKLWTCHHENLDLSSWKSQPFIMKILTIYHENLDRSSWKSRPFIMKMSTVRKKISAVREKMSTCLRENKSQLLAEMAFHKLLYFHALNWVLRCTLAFFSLLLCGKNRILKVTVLFVSNFFQSFRSAGKLVSFQWYWFIKGLIFVILCGVCFFFPQFFHGLFRQLPHT